MGRLRLPPLVDPYELALGTPSPSPHSSYRDISFMNEQPKRTEHAEHGQVVPHADPHMREEQRKLQAEHDAQLTAEKAQRDPQSRHYDPKVAEAGQKRDRDAHEASRAREGAPLDTAA